MPTFSFPDAFEEHKQYIPLLKKALLQVKPDTQKKFLYFKQYPFGAKKLPLVLVDFDLNCPVALAKAGHKPTDEGIVTLTPQDELNFEPKKGNLKRIRLKKYFATMGSGIKEVFVPPGEVEDEDDDLAMPVATEATPPQPMGNQMERKMEFEENEFKRRQVLARVAELQAAAFPPALEALKKQVLDKSRSLAGENRFADADKLLDLLAAKLKTLPSRPAPPTSPPPIGNQMENKMEFEENEFKRRELTKRIEELQKKAVAPPMEAAKKQALEKAQGLGDANNFTEANQTLDRFAASLKTLPSRPAPPSTPAPALPEVPKERKLSTYIATTASWRKARATAASELQRLEKVIAAACDGEPVREAVFKKLPQLHTLVMKLDDRLSEALSSGAKTTDPDKQLDLDKQTRQLAAGYLATLRGHPLAPVVDENPFGSFNVIKGLEGVLTKIEADFS